MKFRYDIGFLRAFAVLIVVFFHYQIPFFEGGFIGVDIFFVISGFLMTSIVLNKITSDSFDLLDFYKRRFVRIVPALIVMIIGVLLITFYLYFPVDFKQVSSYSLFSSFFLSNYYYLFNSGYFDPSSQSNILLHTWSLSVEWQFYMVYPILLLLLKKLYLKKIKIFNTIFLSIIVISFLLVVVFNNFLPPTYTKVSFFSVTHRAWEMMVGGLAFLYGKYFLKIISVKSGKIITFFCFLGLLISTVFFSEDELWPSTLTILPVLCTFFIIAINKDYSFYENKQIQYIGNISYSWYLWHWPLYVIAKYFGYHGWNVILILFVLSLLFSVVSYEIIEKKTRIIPTKAIFIITSLAILFSIFGSIFSLNNYMFDKKTIKLTEFKSSYETTRRRQFNSGVCHNTHKINYNSCLELSSDKKNILLLGDSHAGQYSLSLRNKINTDNYKLIEHTVVGSFPLINAKGEKTSTLEFDEILNDFIPRNKSKLETIIISCNWLNHASNSGNSTYKELARSINETISYLENLNIKVVILGQTEKYIMNFPRVQAFKLNKKDERSYVLEKSETIHQYLKETIPSTNYVDLFMLNNIIRYDKDTNTPYMFDENHLTLSGADQVVSYLISKKII